MTTPTGLAVTRDGSDNGTTPKSFRLGIGALLAKNSTSPLDVRKGVLWDGGGTVVTGNGDMSYNVRAANFVVMPSTTQGPIIITNDALVNVATTAAPGSNSRIDVVWVRQHLVVADGGTDTDVIAQIGVTQGTVGASPTAPALPAGAVELGRATVTSGTTATTSLTITQSHLWTCTNGAPIPVRNDTERDALTGVAGTIVNHLGVKALQRTNGTGWKLLTPIRGKKSVTLSGSTGSAAVSFGTTLSSLPVVVTSVEHPSLFGSPSSTSTTGFTANARLYTGTSTSTFTVHWMALEEDA